MLLPLIRMPAAHRRNPLSFRHALPPRRERFLDVADRRRVLEDRVIAGTVREAHAVDVRLDQPGNRGAALEVDHRRVLPAPGDRPADRDESTVSNRDGVGDRVAVVHRVDATVREHERLIGPSASTRVGRSDVTSAPTRMPADDVTPATKAAAAVVPRNCRRDRPRLRSLTSSSIQSETAISPGTIGRVRGRRPRRARLPRNARMAMKITSFSAVAGARPRNDFPHQPERGLRPTHGPHRSVEVAPLVSLALRRCLHARQADRTGQGSRSTRRADSTRSGRSASDASGR